MQNFFWQADVQPLKIILYTYTFRLKQGLKLSILGRKMQNLLRQGGIQPPKLINAYKFRLKGPEIKLFFLNTARWKSFN